LHQRRIVGAGQFGDVFDAERVDGQRFVQRFAEVDAGGGIDDQIDAACQRMELGLGQAEAGRGDFARHAFDALGEELGQIGRMFGAQAVEDGGGGDIALEALAGIAAIRASADQQDDAADIGYAAHQLFQHNFGQKAGTAGDQDALAGQRRVHIQGWLHRVSQIRYQYCNEPILERNHFISGRYRLA
jgi:hypothetical protein